MRCFFCGKSAKGFLVRCEECKGKTVESGKWSIAKKLEMAERIKGIDKLEKQI